MTPTELKQLTNAQQKNALLAIALGEQLHPLGYRDYWFAKNTVLSSWQPQNDKALMWDLVCEMSIKKTIGSYTSWNLMAYVCMGGYSIVNSVISCYISADPKGNIAKWRKEND